MSSKLTRIESKYFEKLFLLVKILALLSVILIIWLISNELYSGGWRRAWEATPIVLYFVLRNQSKKRLGQFIEFTKDKVCYKVNTSEIWEVNNSEIVSSEFKLNYCYLKLTEDRQRIISLKDFKSYEKRKQIKAELEKLNEK